MTPEYGSLDPRPGDNGGPPLEPTRLVREIVDNEWQEYEFPSMRPANHGILGEIHPDLR
jgi:hypothetical protein